MTNARLGVRAGSELSTLEIAAAHARNGHQVAIFTLIPGDLAADHARRSAIPIFGIADQAALVDFRPDLVHAHHWPTVVALEWLGVVAPWVIGFLGTDPPLENPPPLLPDRRVPWWTLNPVAAATLGEIPGWGDSPHAVVGNWFDDHDVVIAPSRAPSAIRRLLVVSNHFPADVRRDLADVATELGIEVTFVGLPDRQVVVDQHLLRRFDGVVSLGRTVVLAMAVGVPALVLDHHGADGWVTPSDVDGMAHHNFSGRCRRIAPTPERLRDWLLHPPSPADCEEVQRWAFRSARLSGVLATLAPLYAEPCTLPPSHVFGRGSLAVGELLTDVDRTAEHHARRAASELALVVAQRDDALAQRDDARVQFDAVLAQRDDALAQRDALVNSRIWRSTAGYRRLRRRLTIRQRP